jgi:hypothetical protein
MRRQWQPGAIVADDYDNDHNDSALGESGACHREERQPNGRQPVHARDHSACRAVGSSRPASWNQWGALKHDRSRFMNGMSGKIMWT